MNTIRLLACGGAGINLATSIAEKYNINISGLAEMSITAIDTSSAEKLNTEKIGMDFIHIKSTKFDAEELNGSGGNRNENAGYITVSVNEYLDNNPDILKASATDFYVLTTSLSGGTGSVIAPILASRLVGLGHNVVIVGVSDTSSEMDTRNSLDSLNLITLAANKAGRNIAMYNICNGDYDNMDTVNGEVTSMLLTLGTFLSSDIVSIDPKDMAVLLNPTMIASKFKIPTGIVELETFVGDEPELNEKAGVLVHREIRNDRATIKSGAIAYKRGELSGELLGYYDEAGLLPLSIRTLAGEIVNIKNGLQAELDKFEVVQVHDDIPNQDDELSMLI